MFSLKESADTDAANHSFKSRGSHSGPNSGPEKIRRVSDDGALDPGDAGVGYLLGKRFEHLRAITVEAIGNARIPVP